MKWAELADSPDIERWALALAAIRAEQPEHPDAWAELHTGPVSTCRTYMHRIKRGETPSRPWVALMTAGYEFRVTRLGDHRATLWARWNPSPIDLRGTVVVAHKGDHESETTHANENDAAQSHVTKETACGHRPS